MPHSRGFISIAGALVALPLIAPLPALAKHHHNAKSAGGSKKTDSVAYPNAPGGMPAAGDKGKPVMPKADAAAKPPVPEKASTESAPAKTATPTTAYPNAPGGMPAAADKGMPVQPKP